MNKYRSGNRGGWRMRKGVPVEAFLAEKERERVAQAEKMTLRRDEQPTELYKLVGTLANDYSPKN